MSGDGVSPACVGAGVQVPVVKSIKENWEACHTELLGPCWIFGGGYEAVLTYTYKSGLNFLKQDAVSPIHMGDWLWGIGYCEVKIRCFGG